MKLKDIVQVTIFTVVAFILNMAVSTATGMLGTLSLYIAAGFSSFVVAPPFIIMAKKLQKYLASNELASEEFYEKNKYIIDIDWFYIKTIMNCNQILKNKN